MITLCLLTYHTSDMHQNNASNHERSKQNHDKVILYFRGADKISYRYYLDDQTDLYQIKENIARKRNISSQNLKFMYEGHEFNDLSQLQSNRKSHIIHIVNIEEIVKKQLRIVINFQDRYKQTYTIQSSCNIRSFVDKIQQENQTKVTDLVCLGKKLDQQKTFEQQMVEDGTQIYALNLAESNELLQNKATIFQEEKIKEKILNQYEQMRTQNWSVQSQCSVKKSVSIDSESFIEKINNETLQKPKQKRMSWRQLLEKGAEHPIFREQNNKQDDSVKIVLNTKEPQVQQKFHTQLTSVKISNCFDVHAIKPIKFDRESYQNQQEKHELVLPHLDYNALVRKSMSNSQVDLKPEDVIFYGSQEIYETQNFLSQGLIQFRLLFEKK